MGIKGKTGKYKRTEETKERMRLSKLGNQNPMYGKHLSDETKAKLSKAHSGTNAYNYKGISSFDYLERRRFQNAMQKRVFERDNYTCQLCGERGKALQVDHIQSWADYVELRFNIENCRTLCMKCHYEITFGKPMPPTVRAWGHNLSRRALP